VGDIVTIDNIYYDLDRTTLRADASRELDKLVTTMRRYPSLVIEIRSHTDSRGDANYNRLVRLPYPVSHENMWRKDGLYDLVAVLGFNDLPRSQGRGSAIFLHLAHPDYRATAGCVAIARNAMLTLLAQTAPGDRVLIE